MRSRQGTVHSPVARCSPMSSAVRFTVDERRFDVLGSINTLPPGAILAPHIHCQHLTRHGHYFRLACKVLVWHVASGGRVCRKAVCNCAGLDCPHVSRVDTATQQRLRFKGIGRECVGHASPSGRQCMSVTVLNDVSAPGKPAPVARPVPCCLQSTPAKQQTSAQVCGVIFK